MSYLVIFGINDQQFAIDLVSVDRVIQAVETTDLPNAPAWVKGVINIHGSMLSVVSMRKIFELPEKELSPSDQFIICNTSGKQIALWVDDVKGITAADLNKEKKAETSLIHQEALKCAIRTNDKITLVYDIDKLLLNQG